MFNVSDQSMWPLVFDLKNNERITFVIRILVINFELQAFNKTSFLFLALFICHFLICRVIYILFYFKKKKFTSMYNAYYLVNNMPFLPFVM